MAEALYASSASGGLIPAPSAGIGLNEAYAIQERVFKRRRAQVAGWKLGVTSEAAQTRMKLSCPVAGRLASSDILHMGHEITSTPGTLYAEAELAVILESDLPARTETYHLSEIAPAIGAVYAAIEFCASRYVDDEVEGPALVADNAFAHRLVIGRSLASGWDSRFESMEVTLDRGQGRSTRGSTADVMGNPLEAVLWLANWLSSRGETLVRGQVIATGSCTGVTEVHAGDTVRALFAGAEGAAASIVARK